MIAIGVGCRRGAAKEAIVGMIGEALARFQSLGEPARLYSIERKRDEPGLLAAARELGLPLDFLSLDALRAVDDKVATRSPQAEAAVGVASVSEAAALAGAGAEARLIAPRMTGDGVTCAVARGARAMTVHFIGAGPGAPDLITIRGRDLIARCPVCLYAGSLVPRALLTFCPPAARIIDTAPLALEAIVAEFMRAHTAGMDVARLHSGDLSLWSAMGEQLRELDKLGIPYDVTPGVPSFAAAAAALKRELTLPEVAQSLALTRTGGRASPMPAKETLANFAATGATLAIHLSIHALGRVVAELAPFYGADCPAAVVYRASWPDERVIEGTLATIAAEVAETNIERTALILIGPALAARDFRPSALYDAAYQRRFRGEPQ